MGRDQENWEKQTDGTYTRDGRGYSASVSIAADGKATLTITGPGAPAAATYDTRRAAFVAFRKFLFVNPVT